MNDTKSNEWYPVLDLLRFVAALTVVVFHCFKGGGLIPNAVLAVDFFFLLSGFVLGSAYDKRLRESTAVGELILRRLIRIYPIIFLSGFLSFILIVGRNIFSQAQPHDSIFIISTALLSFLCLPYLFQNNVIDSIFPFNPPLWSLFFEIVASLLYLRFGHARGVKITFLYVSAAAIIVAHGGNLGGTTPDTFLQGFPRVIAGFFGGVLIFRIKTKYLSAHSGTGSPSVAALSFVTLILAPVTPSGMNYIIYLIAFGVIIIYASAIKSTSRRNLYKLMGEVSYPLYALHWLTMYVFSVALIRFKSHGVEYGFIVVLQLVVAPVFCWFVVKYWERPLRHMLTSKLLGGQRKQLIP